GTGDPGALARASPPQGRAPPRPGEKNNDHPPPPPRSPRRGRPEPAIRPLDHPPTCRHEPRPRSAREAGHRSHRPRPAPGPRRRRRIDAPQVEPRLPAHPDPPVVGLPPSTSRKSTVSLAGGSSTCTRAHRSKYSNATDPLAVDGDAAMCNRTLRRRPFPSIQTSAGMLSEPKAATLFRTSACSFSGALSTASWASIVTRYRVVPVPRIRSLPTRFTSFTPRSASTPPLGLL